MNCTMSTSLYNYTPCNSTWTCLNEACVNVSKTNVQQQFDRVGFDSTSAKIWWWWWGWGLPPAPQMCALGWQGSRPFGDFPWSKVHCKFMAFRAIYLVVDRATIVKGNKTYQSSLFIITYITSEKCNSSIRL